jgi:hypothetical protein
LIADLITKYLLYVEHARFSAISIIDSYSFGTIQQHEDSKKLNKGNQIRVRQESTLLLNAWLFASVW